MKVIELTVTQVRIYDADSLSFADVRLPKNVKILREAFGFEGAQPDATGSQLNFTNGSYDYKGSFVHILSLVVETRKLTLQVRGTSEMAEGIYDRVSELCQSFDSRTEGPPLNLILKVDETVCVASLEIDFNDLLAPPLAQFMTKDAKAHLKADKVNPRSVAFSSLTFEVRYDQNEQLNERDVTLLNKSITIQPRSGTPRQERRFYTSSPMDSTTHQNMLRLLERQLAKPETPNPRKTRTH